MNTRSVNTILSLMISSMLALPACARGGGFGGGHFGGGGFGGARFGGGGFGGGHFGGGGGRDFGGSRDFGSGFGGRSSRDFGGGFNSLGGGNRGGGLDRGNLGNEGFGDRGAWGGNQGIGNRGSFGGNDGFGNRGAWGGQGFGNRPDMPISSRPSFSNHLPTDGGFSGISGIQNRNPTRINNNDLHNQGQNIRNSFNNNNITRNNQFNNVNNYNVNRYGGYGGYGAGWAHGWNASNAYHGYWGYPGAWGCPGWSEATMWTCMGLTSLSTFLGLGLMGAELSSSNKSSSSSPANVVYEGDNVYINGQPAGTAPQYYQQAQQLASQGWQQADSQYANSQYPPLAPDATQQASAGTGDQWAPLGVFSLAEPGQSQANMLLQLAIDPQGDVRGNYLNQLTNEKSQVYGALDKKTQRVSFTIGQNNSTVFDTSLSDLVKDDSQILVHYGPNNTQEMALIRLPAPSGTDATQPATTATQTAGGAGP